LVTHFTARMSQKDQNGAIPIQVTGSDPSFVVIKYGDDQEALINPFCSTYIFIDWIRQIVKCDKDILLDLVDLEGQLRNLPVTTEEYATEYVTGRETYVVISVERQGDDGPRKYVSLLNNLDKSNPELSKAIQSCSSIDLNSSEVKLNDLSRPGTRSARRERGKKATSKSSRSLKAENNGKRPNSTEKEKPRSRQGK